MDFSLTELFVVPTSNSLPTSGSTYNLAPGQVGIFNPDYTPANAGTIANQPYIIIAQGRQEPSLPTLTSDRIAKSKVKLFTKVTGNGTFQPEIWTISNFTIQCNKPVTVTINVHSFYLDTAFFNGLTRSFTVVAPCCQCGQDPCVDVDNEAMVDLLIAKFNEDFSYNRQMVNLNRFFTFTKVGTGASAYIQIQSKPLDRYGNECDLAANPYMFDRIWSRVFVYEGTDTTSDFLVYDRCNPAATTTLVQSSTFPTLVSDEVAQLEKDFYRYKVDRFYFLKRFPDYNPLFESYVSSGTVYNQYMIQFDPYDTTYLDYAHVSHQDERVLIYVPQALDAQISSLLTAYLGTPQDVSGFYATSTSTTTTTTTV